MDWGRKSREENLKGAVTVEYAMVFPVVILCVYVIIYWGLLCYQQALLYSVVSENAQNWALLFPYEHEKISSEYGICDRKGLESEALYGNLFVNDTMKKKAVCETVKTQFMDKSILKPAQEIEVAVVYNHHILTRKIHIEATVYYKLPAKGLFQWVGASGQIPLSACGEASVYHPKEFIQNTDYLLQIYEESGARDWVEEKLAPLKESLKKCMDYFK